MTPSDTSIINGVHLSSDAIETLHDWQEEENAGLNEFMETIVEAVRILSSNNQEDDPEKRFALVSELLEYRNKLKMLRK
ncbi:hypothetical protein [uncultured Bacteroides sp.]|uniref:hypothetical protein n=1 Tax=uncultured Bacteroides sp. TaxID=162156 RepID=UPI002616D1E5|nr:hypothetical protein [uncultured Bacteroides sp.]